MSAWVISFPVALVDWPVPGKPSKNLVRKLLSRSSLDNHYSQVSTKVIFVKFEYRVVMQRECSNTCRTAEFILWHTVLRNSANVVRQVLTCSHQSLTWRQQIRFPDWLAFAESPRLHSWKDSPKGTHPYLHVVCLNQSTEIPDEHEVVESNWSFKCICQISKSEIQRILFDCREDSAQCRYAHLSLIRLRLEKAPQYLW